MTTQNHSIETAVLGAIEATCRTHLDLREDPALHDLGLDSMGLIAVVARIEATYAIEFTTEQMVRLMQADSVLILADSLVDIVRSSSSITCGR
jgi:acyl carrier protein